MTNTADLYPTGHVEHLSLADLTTERARQHQAQDEALARKDYDAAGEAVAKAITCTTEIIRRNVVELVGEPPA